MGRGRVFGLRPLWISELRAGDFSFVTESQAAPAGRGLNVTVLHRMAVDPGSPAD